MIENNIKNIGLKRSIEHVSQRMRERFGVDFTKDDYFNLRNCLKEVEPIHASDSCYCCDFRKIRTL